MAVRYVSCRTPCAVCLRIYSAFKLLWVVKCRRKRLETMVIVGTHFCNNGNRCYGWLAITSVCVVATVDTLLPSIKNGASYFFLFEEDVFLACCSRLFILRIPGKWCSPVDRELAGPWESADVFVLDRALKLVCACALSLRLVHIERQATGWTCRRHDRKMFLLLNGTSLFAFSDKDDTDNRQSF